MKNYLPLTPPYTGGETNARSATMFQCSISSPLERGNQKGANLKFKI